MTERVKELEEQLMTKEQQLREALEKLERLQAREAENVEIIGDLIGRMVHDINNLNTRIRSSSTTLSHAFSDLRQHLPTLLFQMTPEHQRAFFALVERAYHNQRQQTQRLSSREERQLRRALTQELEAHNIDDVDEMADMLVDMGVYEDISPFIPLLREEHSASVLQAAYSLMSLQEVHQWKLTPAYSRILQITHTLRNSIVALVANHRTECGILEGIEKVLALYQHQLEQRQIEVLKQYEETPAISCYAGLDLVWENLIENAIEAIESPGTLEITVTQHPASSIQHPASSDQHPASSNQYIIVQITDSGCGIPEETRATIFERLFTTKPSGAAVHGAGLYIVRKIVDRHQGKIEVESQPGKTTFRVWLPAFPLTRC